MVIQVRYRDVSFDEITDCLQPCITTPRNRATWESKMRGKPVCVEIPKVSDEVAIGQYEQFRCCGPFYLTPNLAPNSAVCVHIAEIGD